MKKSCHALGIAGGIAFYCLVPTSPVKAQIVPDSTLPVNSIVTPQDNTTLITGGTVAGSNLFHSFEQFSIPTGSTALFNNTSAIQNIISRVTGGSVSNIDGLIRAKGTANLFLLNPNGIIFGSNAQLNIGGSFLGSTASSLKFADSNQFSATAPQTTPLLTVSVPIGLQFGGTAGRILVQGPGNNLSFDPTTFAFVRGENPVGLQVQPGKTLALIGGDVTLSGGNLIASGGRIEVGSVAGSGLVSFTPTDKGWALGYQGVPSFRDIQLSGRASVDASGLGGGDIQVQGSRVTLEDGSAIFALTSGAKPGGTVAVNTSDSIELIGTSADGKFPSAVFTDTNGAGSAGDLTINTERLIVRDGAEVTSDTLGEGDAGNLTVNADTSVQLIGLSADGRFGSGLFAEAVGAGAAGDLTINTGQLVVQNGANVSTSISGEGDAGSLTVNASDSVKLMGTTTTADGQPLVSVLVAETYGAKAGGSLTINTRQLLVQDGGFVSTATSGSGKAGTLAVTASDSVKLLGESADGFPSGLFTLVGEEEATGAGGDLTLKTQQLSVQDGAEISVSSQGSGDAGNLEVTARSIRLDDQAALNADTTAGQGNIILRSGDLVLRRGSNITTDATGTATGGNITINTDILAALENSDISANAQEARGGQVRIDAQGIFSTEFRERENPATSDITATSLLGSEFSGTVEINTPDVDPSQGLVELPAELVDASGLIASGCGAGGENEFIVTGRGGLPPSPTDPLSSDTVWSDLRTFTQQAENRTSSEEATQPTSAEPTPIVEATGWVINNKGEVVLTANAPNATPHIPWLPSTTCHAPKTSS